MLNYHYSQIYNGKMILRFDDTNPDKEKVEFVHNIIKDLKTCEIYPAKVTYTSDYFDQIQELMKEFIKAGLAYADNTESEQMKIERDAGIESKHRENSIKDNLEIFEKMLDGKGQGWCIRAKLDMQDKVKCLRDPVMYRCNDTPHHKTGTKYRAYPTYDFACPIVDALEKVTNCLRTIEYKDRDTLYHFIQEKLKLPVIDIFEYSKLQLKSTLMSKRKLQWFVDEGLVEGWYDPRFPTVQGLMRRGLTVQTLKEFMLEQGPSLNTIRMEWDKLWATNKKIIDPFSKRYYAILKDTAAEVYIENGPESPEGITIDYHPKDPSLGSKTRILTNHIFVEKEDVADLKVGDKFTLSRWYNVVVKSKEESDGKIKLVVTATPEDKEFKGTTKATFVAVDERFYTSVTIYEFGHLITKDAIREEDDVAKFVNHNSKIRSEGYADKDIERVKAGDFIQIERRGYFFVDKDLANNGEIVLHFIPDGKTKNMSKIASKIDSSSLTKGEGEGGKAANKAEEAKKKGEQESDKPLSKNQLKKLANKQKKKEKKAVIQEEAPQ
jgi:glutamyl-tRNA synthetase